MIRRIVERMTMIPSSLRVIPVEPASPEDESQIQLVFDGIAVYQYEQFIPDDEF